jgi:hypothetical protein
MYGVYRSDSHIAFWSEALNNLKAVLETGFDRRIYDRPMLGILIGGLISEESQAHFASPVDYGIRLSGTVPGMGAEKLGMIENDILTEMNNEEIHDYRVLEKIVSRFKSGDVTQVTWYRGGHKLTGEMAFSGRPTPFVPPFPAELADYVESIYRRSDSELASILEGVVEVQAEYRPFEHEWNIKQILAHTIVMERSLHLWITATRKGELMKPWFTNDQELIDSVVSTYPSLEQLVFELKCAQKLTVNLLRRLPPELATLKAPYLNIVTNLGEQGVPLHTRMHFESIKALLAEQN